MNKKAHFEHYARGKGRPQIVLVGNGLEYNSGQPSWEGLVNMLTVPDSIKLDPKDQKRLPFPLLYELLSSHAPAPHQLSEKDINEEQERLRAAMLTLSNKSNFLLDILPTLGADHIFTTNYSYCIEKAFYPEMDFSLKKSRSKVRFNLNSEQKNGKRVREICYRMHTGYLAKNDNGSDVGIWHIHGECSVPHGVVVGHDRYGRLLSRIETIIRSQKFNKNSGTPVLKQFTSWPELFLYGDIYFIGFGFNLCEYDLWWLLRRKQRERNADGNVYFYDKGTDKENVIRNLFIQAHGGIINPGITEETDFDTFYKNALEDISRKISVNRQLIIPDE